MGEKVVAGGFDLSDRQEYRRKLQQCLAGLGRLLDGETVRPAQESDGSGDRAESRGFRRACRG